MTKDSTKLSAGSSKWVDALVNERPGPNSEQLIEWVRRGLPPAKGGPLEVGFLNWNGETKTLSALPEGGNPEKFTGALFDGDVLVARMTIAWSEDPLEPATFTVEQVDSERANKHCATNGYPLANVTDLSNFFTALFDAIKEHIQQPRT